MRANSYCADSLLSPQSAGEFAFSRAYNGEKLWTYFGKEGNEAKQKRFGCAMGAVGKILDRNESVVDKGVCVLDYTPGLTNPLSLDRVPVEGAAGEQHNLRCRRWKRGHFPRDFKGHSASQVCRSRSREDNRERGETSRQSITFSPARPS